MIGRINPLYLEEASRMFRIFDSATDVGYQPCILEFDLALTADYYSATRAATEMTQVEIDHRCEHIVPRLTSRCEGLLEVHGYQNRNWGSSPGRDSFDESDGDPTIVTVYQHQPWRKVHLAAAAGNWAMVKLLLKKSTDIDRKDAREWTALHWAASKGHGNQWTSAVNILLLNKANVHAKDKSEMTALHWAAGNGHAKTVSALLDKGANIHAKNADETAALHWAAVKGRTDVVRVLLDKATTRHEGGHWHGGRGADEDADADIVR